MVGWFFVVVVRSQQKPKYECIFVSSFILNFLVRKDFTVQIFQKLAKNLPLCGALIEKGLQFFLKKLSRGRPPFSVGYPRTLASQGLPLKQSLLQQPLII